MISFIKELNDPNNVKLKLIDKYYYKDIKINSLPEDLIKECYDVIKELDRLNPLELTKEEESYEFTNYYVDSNNGLYTNNILNNYEEDLRFNRFNGYDLYSGLKFGIKSFNNCGITNNGFNKMMELLRKYIYNYKEEQINKDDLVLSIGELVNIKKNFECGRIAFGDYITSVNDKVKSLDDNLAKYLEFIEMMFNLKKDFLTTKNKICDYIDISSKILKMQKRLPKELEEKCNKCISEVQNYKFKFNCKDRDVDMKLSNAFYITPYKHLYNVSNHKFASIYNVYRNIIQDSNSSSDLSEDIKYYQDKYNTFKNQEYFTTHDFWFYFNLVYKCFFLKDIGYMDADNDTKRTLERLDAKCYNRTILELIMGIESANASIYEFFDNLKKNAINYEEEIAKISKMDFPDFLVRCCGFHKVESQVNKTITTSQVNFEDAFSEYINRGWKIDFIPPIVLNNGVLEEYNNDFLIIRKVLKKEK